MFALQNVLLPSPRTCTEELLYFRRGGTENAVQVTEKGELCIFGNSSISFDTYFNGFSVEKWKKYTNVGRIFLTLEIMGNVRVTLMRKERRSDREVLTGTITEQLLCAAEKAEKFTLAFDTAQTQGMYCFSLQAVDKAAMLYSACYETELAELQPVKLALDICTFKREKFIERNLENLNTCFLQNPASYLYSRLEVFISDNAGTLDISALSGEKVHIYKNKNAGGAGGFTRGMIEIGKVREKHGITHILVTDDDIVYEPESIFRTCTFLSCVKKEYRDIFVGGAMLRLDTQYIQTEAGALWNGGALVSLKHGVDLRSLESCLYNETEEQPQFNAWWFCAFPAEVVTDTNLPMPLFIRGDDVEYGLRNMHSLLLMNGICVWHEPFENKYSSSLSYYIFRNRLIDNALHNMNMPAKLLKKELYGYVMNEVRLYRYRNADLLMQGAEDFLAGVDWLAEQDGEALHRKVIGAGYLLQPLADLGEGIYFDKEMLRASQTVVQPTGILHRIIANRTVNGTFLPPLREYNIIPTEGIRQISVFRTRTVLNYDVPSGRGFVTRRDPKKARKCMARLKALYGRIDREYEGAVRDYAENAGRLQTLEFWEKYLDLAQNNE